MQRILFLLFGMLLFSACQSNVLDEDETPRYQVGDQTEWARPDYDDSEWLTARGPNTQQIFWARAKVKLHQQAKGELGLHIESFGAYDAYWDGVLIGHNGRIPIAGKAEVPGTGTVFLRIPDSLAQLGTHTLALRMSQSYLPEVIRPIGITLDDYVNMIKAPLVTMAFMNLMAGAFLIAAIYYFFLFFSSRHKAYPVFIFGVICFLFFALLMMEYLKFYVDIPYTRFFWRLEAIGWLTFAIALLVPWYFSLQFHFFWKKLVLIVMLVTLLVVYWVNYGHYDFTAFCYNVVMWVVSVAIVLTAIYQKEKGAIIVLIGLFATVFVQYYIAFDFGLFINFTIIVLCMLYLHALRTKVIEEEYQSSLLLSSRLKLELIKKNIQPHFLKNTLTSLIDWVEESPKEGAAFIQALANEFDIMNSIADETLIPIQQEIELCKSHLMVMHYRKEIEYLWEDHGIVAEELIPPALIHTILENGITHSMPRADGTIGFSLSFNRLANAKQYIFETRAQNRKVELVREGNGFGYVKARLAESYGDKWQLLSGPTPDGWQTIIKIEDK